MANTVVVIVYMALLCYDYQTSRVDMLCFYASKITVVASKSEGCHNIKNALSSLTLTSGLNTDGDAFF